MNKNEVVGKTYQTAGGTKFKVVNAESYPAATVSKRYKDILAFKPGYLVAVPYRTALIPNITLEGGVARITVVEVNGEIIDRPHAISTALGIKDAMSSYSIKEQK